MADESTVTGIHHVGLSVADLDRAVAFYQGATGLEAAAPADERAGVAVLEGPNGRLRLTERSSAGAQPPVMPVEGPGITHVCYQSATVDDLYGRFQRVGSTPVSRGTEPVDLGGYGVYYVYARDLDGIMFEVEHIDGADFDAGYRFAHVALASSDLDALVGFYELLLGREPYRRSDDIQGLQFDRVAGIDGVHLRAAWFETGNMVLELWQYLHPAPVAPAHPPSLDRIGYDSIVFAVDDLPREVDRLVDHGVVFDELPTESDRGLWAQTRDPDGNPIRLVQDGRA
ncbi:MAG: VOC family protein, partial [Acidimicrobiia bacterium]|nr:VOC family protein [Acidimicrobiia bacterium]